MYLLILLLNFDRIHVQRPANEKETLVAVRAVEADVTSVPPVVMQTTTPTSTNIIERMLEPESRETTEYMMGVYCQLEIKMQIILNYTLLMLLHLMLTK